MSLRLLSGLDVVLLCRLGPAIDMGLTLRSAALPVTTVASGKRVYIPIGLPPDNGWERCPA